MNEESKWIKKLDLTKLELYPIQFANVERIKRKDAIFIFDEVGTGKTISSGMMALEYLEKNSEKEVLIITTNSLAKSDGISKGQFLEDWFEKLPFEYLAFEQKITIINNHYTNINNNIKNWGMIIIDEAHLFLNRYSERYKYLCHSNMSADKVVIMTASPIKESEEDLNVYKEIANSLLPKEKAIGTDWIEELKCVGKEPKQIVSSKFNIDSPVTRYFKDTVVSINESGEFIKKQAKRLIPEIWEYSYDNGKNKALLDGINRALEDQPESCFVIFTIFVDREAIKIGEFLNLNGYTKGRERKDLNDKVYYIVTGENREELSYFSRKDKLPTILILTCQIAEQGVNLPGFNYVVNYNIPAYPSSLEQRFGRIDRMGRNGSAFEKIKMSFLINKDYWDTNTSNFYQAVSTYIHSMISYIPSKNTLLDENIINNYLEKKSLAKEYIENIERLIKDKNEISILIEYYKNCNIEISSELIDFCESHNIEINIKDNSEEINRKTLEDFIKKELIEIDKLFKDEEINFEDFKAFIKSMEDKVFYSQDEKVRWSFDKEKVKTVDAIEMGKWILEDEKSEFKKHCTEFNKKIKIPLVFKKYRNRFENFFERIFIENKKVIIDEYTYELFDILFSNEYAKFNFGKQLSISQKDYELLNDNLNQLIPTLPFFKMCRKFKNIIQHKICINNKRYYYRRFNFNPFTRAIDMLLNSYSINTLDVSNEFKEKYLFNGGKVHIQVIENDGVVTASNWLKLFYWYSRIEEVAFYEDKNGFVIRHMGKSNNFYCIKELEREIKNIEVDYKHIYEETINRLKREVEKFDIKYSLFIEFYYTDSIKVRANIPYSFHCNYWKRKEYDDLITKKIFDQF